MFLIHHNYFALLTIKPWSLFFLLWFCDFWLWGLLVLCRLIVITFMPRFVLNFRHWTWSLLNHLLKMIHEANCTGTESMCPKAIWVAVSVSVNIFDKNINQKNLQVKSYFKVHMKGFVQWTRKIPCLEIKEVKRVTSEEDSWKLPWHA